MTWRATWVLPSTPRENLAARVIGLRLVAHRPCPWPHLYDLPGNMGTTLNPSRRLGSMCHRPAACCASPGCFKASSSTVGACFTTSFMADSTASWVALPASAYGFTWAAFARAPFELVTQLRHHHMLQARLACSFKIFNQLGPLHPVDGSRRRGLRFRSRRFLLLLLRFLAFGGRLLVLVAGLVSLPPGSE